MLWHHVRSSIYKIFLGTASKIIIKAPNLVMIERSLQSPTPIDRKLPSKNEKDCICK